MSASIDLATKRAQSAEILGTTAFAFILGFVFSRFLQWRTHKSYAKGAR